MNGRHRMPLRRRLHDTLGRWLGLSCPSRYTPVVAPGQLLRTYRCEGRAGHAFRHAGGGVIWPDHADDRTHPGTAPMVQFLILTHTLGTQQHRLRTLARAYNDVALTRDACLQLRDALSGELDEPFRARAQQLLNQWFDSLEHLDHCVGIQHPEARRP